MVNRRTSRWLLLTALGLAAVVLRWAMPALPRPSAAALRSVGWEDLPRWLASQPPAQTLSTVAALAAWGCLGWLTVSIVAVVLSRLPGRIGNVAEHLAERVTPAVLRRALHGALGVAVVTGSVPMGMTGVAAAAVPGPAAPAADVEPWPELDRVPGREPSASGRQPHGAAPSVPRQSRPARQGMAAARSVVVQPGDTLWAIASRSLPARPSSAEVAAAWPRWYAANRHAIGPNPDLLVPGQRLRPPAKSRAMTHSDHPANAGQPR